MDREEVEKQMYSSKIRMQNLISQKRLDDAQKFINDYDKIYIIEASRLRQLKI